MKLPTLLFGFLWTSAALAATPNILLIVADDQGYGDCSAYPQHAADIHTPNLDRIAHDGALFTQGYVSAPVCSPSRTGLITGRYQQRFDKAAGWHTTLPKSATTIAEHLHAAGYATMMIGKNDFGHQLDSKEDRRYPMNHGYDHHLGFEAHAHDYFALTREAEQSATIPHGDSPNIGPLDFDRGTKDFPQGYTTEIFTDAAIDFLQTNREHPFFLALAYNAVHDLVEQVPPKYLEKYGVKPIPRYDPKIHGTYAAYYNTYNKLGVVNETDMRRFYLADLNCLDDNVGRLLDAIEKLHLANNTLIIFISDNGGAPATGGNNHPLRAAKYTTFEGGIRVPFMARWPGHIAKNTIDTPVISLDLLPTFVDAAGAQIDTNHELIDGVSLLPLLTQNNPIANRDLFWKFQNLWAIRRGDYKLVKSRANHEPGGNSSWILGGPTSKQPQLFNLKTDPTEQHDQAADHPEIVRDLTQAYKLWESTHGNMSEK